MPQGPRHEAARARYIRIGLVDLVTFRSQLVVLSLSLRKQAASGARTAFRAPVLVKASASASKMDSETPEDVNGRGNI